MNLSEGVWMVCKKANEEQMECYRAHAETREWWALLIVFGCVCLVLTIIWLLPDRNAK